MKHLKKYKIFESKSLYKKIDDVDYFLDMVENTVEIPKYDIKKIESLESEEWFDRGLYLDESSEAELHNEEYTIHKSIPCLEISLIEMWNGLNGDDKIVLKCIKNNDDWYMVYIYNMEWKGSWSRKYDPEGYHIDNQYYKCDTIDGVLELIADII